MDLWDTNNVVTRLKEGRLSETEKFKYFFVFLFVTGLPMGAYLGFTIAIESRGLWLLQSLLGIIVVISGTKSCFKINENGDGKEFVTRMICLGFPITLKLSILALLILIGARMSTLLILTEKVKSIAGLMSFLMILVGVLMQIMLFQRIGFYLKRFSQVTSEPNTTENTPH